MNPYGRFYYLPKILAKKGHQVYLVLLSYKRDSDVDLHKDGINWVSVSLAYRGPFKYMTRAKRLVREVGPDWIIGFSDTYYGILAQRLAARFGSGSVIDAYDNYEGYIPWCKPLHQIWRASLAKATLVTAAGPSLAQYLAESRPGKAVTVVPMAVDPVGFTSMDRPACRKNYDLPQAKKLVGYCGAIYASRGIEVLFRAFTELRKERSDVGLVMSGRMGRQITLPSEAQWLGYLPNDQMPAFLNSMDVLVVMNRPSTFGSYSYPIKLYEAMRCQVPVVAIETPATRWILRDHRDLLVEPDNPYKLCDKIKSVLSLGRINYRPQPDWNTNCEIFEEALRKHM